MILLQQRTHIWLPVNLEREWPQNPVDTIVMEFFSKLLKCTKRMIGVVVAVILSLIAVATMATVSGMALYTSLQTKHFVEQWHKDSHALWLSQIQINTRLQTQINILKQTVSWIGKKVMVLEKQMWLRCDWNSTTVTNLRYYDSEHDWQLIQLYLAGNTSAVRDINSLQLNIQEVFGRQFDHDDAPALAEAFLKQLEGLDQQSIMQSLTHTARGMGIVLVILLLCAILLYAICIRPTQSSMTTLWKAVLLKNLKKKEGNCED